MLLSNGHVLFMISFKRQHFKNNVILPSYPDIKELAAEHGLEVDHSTINRWAQPSSTFLCIHDRLDYWGYTMQGIK